LLHPWWHAASAAMLIECCCTLLLVHLPLQAEQPPHNSPSLPRSNRRGVNTEGGSWPQQRTVPLYMLSLPAATNTPHCLYCHQPQHLPPGRLPQSNISCAQLSCGWPVAGTLPHLAARAACPAQSSPCCPTEASQVLEPGPPAVKEDTECGARQAKGCQAEKADINTSAQSHLSRGRPQPEWRQWLFQAVPLRLLLLRRWWVAAWAVGACRCSGSNCTLCQSPAWDRHTPQSVRLMCADMRVWRTTLPSSDWLQ
jgi:hypothetical protein